VSCPPFERAEDSLLVDQSARDVRFSRYRPEACQVTGGLSSDRGIEALEAPAPVLFERAPGGLPARQEPPRVFDGG
jgi:hypothetical protein